MAVLRTSIALCFAFLWSNAQADDLSKRHNAAAQCAKHFVEYPSRDVGARNITVMYQHSLSHEIEQTLVVSYVNGPMRADYFRAAGKTYYAQCLEYFDRNAAALKGPAEAILDMKAPQQERWRFTTDSCPDLKKDFESLPSILESNADALRRQLHPPTAAEQADSTQKIVVRSDGPSYRIRLGAQDMDTIEVRPAVGSDLEHLIETILDHAKKCASNSRPQPSQR
jgi:hypothetical protein